MASANRPSPGLLTPHIFACDGKHLVARILAQLRSPYLRKVAAVSYRYNDFDLQRGGFASANSANGLVRLLEVALVNGVAVTVLTSDPFSDPDIMNPKPLRRWYQGLKRLRDAGALVRIHAKLHAKVYLFESEGSAQFFAVGSSNLTYQGMGFMWAECNAGGWHEGEYREVERQVQTLMFAREVEALDDWERRLLRSPQGFMLAGV